MEKFSALSGTPDIIDAVIDLMLACPKNDAYIDIKEVLSRRDASRFVNIVPVPDEPELMRILNQMRY